MNCRTASRFVLAMPVLLLALFSTTARASPGEEKPTPPASPGSEKYQELVKKADDLKTEARALEDEAMELFNNDYLSDAYKTYRAAVRLVRERKATVKLAARETRDKMHLKSLAKSLKDTKKWERSLQETIDLLRMSQ